MDLLSSSLVCICRLEAIGNRNSNGTSHLKAVGIYFSSLSNAADMNRVILLLSLFILCFGEGGFGEDSKSGHCHHPISGFIYVASFIFLFAGTLKGKINSK